MEKFDRKKIRFALFVFVLISSTIAQAQTHSLPIGNPERAKIMDAMRPVAERDLGSPIEFVVRELTASKEWAFVMADVQYKGGGKISWIKTPHFKKKGKMTAEELENVLSVTPDCCSVQSVLQKAENGDWHVVEQEDLATDAWFVKYCSKPARVVMEKWCLQSGL